MEKHKADKHYHGYKIAAWLVALVLGLTACRKQDHFYRDFIKNGEIIYTSRLDSVTAFSGHHRLLLTWPRGIDPNVVRTVVYWNGRRDSVTVEYTHNDADTLHVLFDDMAEGNFTFELVTFDAFGRHSVAYEKLGESLGERYRLSILERPVGSMQYEDGMLRLVWQGGDDDIIGQEVQYLDKAGLEKQVFVPVEQDTLFIGDYDPDRSVRLRSLFQPDSLCIDTFYTDFSERWIGR